jgi:hypothetical protein
MGQGTAETVRELDEIRDRLESDMDELHTRLPAPEVWAKRLVGVLVGGGAAGSALIFLTRRARGKKRAAAAAPARPIIKAMPARFARAIGGTPTGARRRPWVPFLVAGSLVLLLAEVRELRKLREAVSRR